MNGKDATPTFATRTVPGNHQPEPSGMPEWMKTMKPATESDSLTVALQALETAMRTLGEPEQADTLAELIVRVADLEKAKEPVSPPFVDEEHRCAVCGWTLQTTARLGCVRGNCSLRPPPERLYSPERAKREHEAMLGRG